MLKSEIIKIVSAIEFVHLSILIVNEVTQDNPRISKHTETISKQFIAIKNRIRSVLLCSLAELVNAQESDIRIVLENRNSYKYSCRKRVHHAFLREPTSKNSR